MYNNGMCGNGCMWIIILLVVNGEKKAQAVKDCFFGPITPKAPGSILQLHPDFTLVADEAALSLVQDLL